MGRNHTSFDPSSLNDPVAMQTEWVPAKKGGFNFRVHQLVSVDTNRIEFRATPGAKLFYLLFLLVGIGISIHFIYSKLLSGGLSLNMDTIGLLIISVFFTGFGGFGLYTGTSPIVFDKMQGCFWKGRKSPDKVFNKSSLKYFAELKQIHALQLISEYCRGNKIDFYSYELNLVLKNSQRINVIDHGDLEKLRSDAAILSAFLEKPVWNAI
jgi:hypothetical protein